MADTSSRMLRLLSLLQTHRYWPGAELAGRLGVSVRTLRRDVDRLRELGYPVDAGTLTAVAQACRDEERLRFSYTARGGEQTDRHVEPHRLVSLGRRWYLVAYDLTRHDWRSFRLDRLEDPRAMVEQWATVEELDDRRCRLRMTADSLDWPTMALGADGAEFEVVRPPELADHIWEWAHASPAPRAHESGSALSRKTGCHGP
jgi:predicted DNA-binding transcriptional regulator YafY